MHRTLSLAILTAICLLVMSSSEHKTTIFMVGDSTMADKDISKGSPERGWGMVLQGCFTDDIIVENHAKNGRSSISFINEGLWQKVLERIKPGDYVFIQFGHNDEKHDSIIFCQASVDELKSMDVIGHNLDLDLVLKGRNAMFF